MTFRDICGISICMEMDDHAMIYEALAKADSPEAVQAALDEYNFQVQKGSAVMDNPTVQDTGVAMLGDGEEEEEEMRPEDYPDDWEYDEKDDEYGSHDPKRGETVIAVIRAAKAAKKSRAERGL